MIEAVGSSSSKIFASSESALAISTICICATESVRHLGPRIDGAVEQIEDRAGLPVHLGVVDHCSSGWQVLEQDVLAHREARDEIALLVDGADRGEKRVAR